MSASDARRWQGWPLVAIGTAGLVIATVAATISSATGAGARVETTPTPAPETITKTVTTSVFATLISAPAPAPAAPPAAQFGDGTHVVGLDVAPGDYRTAGPSGSNAGGCYWSRRHADGSKITDYGVVRGGPGQITIQGGELVEVNGCQPWSHV